MKKSWIFASLLSAGLATQGAHAATITIDLTTTANPSLQNTDCTARTLSGQKGCLDNGDTASAGGLTLTFSSVTPHTADSLANRDYILADQSGIWFDSDVTDTSAFSNAGSFGISFSQDVYIKSYVVGFSTTSTNTAGGFNILAGSSALNSMVAVGTHAFTDPTVLFLAGTVYTVVGSANDLATLQSLVVETSGTSVPEPGTLALLGLGLAGLGFSRRRKAA